MLKYKYESADLIPEGKESLYAKQDDGSYVLQVEGAVSKSRLDEFRENNTKLRGEVDSVKEAKDAIDAQLKELNEAKANLEKQYEGIDLEEVQRMQTEAQKLKDKELIEAGKVEDLISDRVNKANAASQAKLDELINAHKEAVSKLETNNTGLTGQLNKLVIDNEIAVAATKYGVAETALQDVMNRGRDTFRLEEGKAVAYNDGKMVYADDQVTPQSIDGWMNGLNTNAPHLFTPSAGSGAKPANVPAGHTDPVEMTSNEKIAAGLKNLN